MDTPGREIMRSATVRIPGAEFSGTITALAEWLDANGYEPTRYSYNHSEDAVLVTVDFSAAVVADAFAMHFGGVIPQLASQDSRRQLTT
jgi:hypothetical protein